MVLLVSVFMNDLIQDELEAVLDDWRNGRRIRTIALGHPVRLNRQGQEERHKFRQLATYEYCFQLIELGLAAPLESHAEFCAMAAGNTIASELTTEEREAAESLAWKALVRGWTRATSGFEEEREITIMRRKADA
jgi:hypothetical protein